MPDFKQPITVNGVQIADGVGKLRGLTIPGGQELTLAGSVTFSGAGTIVLTGGATGKALAWDGTQYTPQTIAAIHGNQTANTVFSGPTTGGAAAPAWRALVAADIPSLDASKIGTGALVPARGGTGNSNVGKLIVAGDDTDVTFVPSLGPVAITLPASGTIAMKATSGGIGSAVAVWQDGVFIRADANFNWLGISQRVGIGTNNPDSSIHIINDGTSTYLLHAIVEDAGTTNVPITTTIGHNSSNTPGVGFGQALVWVLKSSTTPDQAAFQINIVWVVATHASRTSQVRIFAYDTAAREGIRIQASGTAPMIGFLGAAAVVRQTLGNAATDAATTQTLANNLRTAMINLGLGQT